MTAGRFARSCWNKGSPLSIGEEDHEPNPHGIGDGGRVRACSHGCHSRDGAGGEAGGAAGGAAQHHAQQCHPGHAQSRRERRQQLPAHQRRLYAEALSPRRADQRLQRPPPAPSLDFPDRRQGVDGDLAHRRQRRDVCDHLVQPSLCAERADRRAALVLQAAARADHDLLLRAEQSRRRGRRGQGLSRHPRRQAGRARRQDRQEGVADRYRRSRARLQRDDGSDRRQRQSAHRHQRRRIRHPRIS